MHNPIANHSSAVKQIHSFAYLNANLMHRHTHTRTSKYTFTPTLISKHVYLLAAEWIHLNNQMSYYLISLTCNVHVACCMLHATDCGLAIFQLHFMFRSRSATFAAASCSTLTPLAIFSLITAIL